MDHEKAKRITDEIIRLVDEETRMMKVARPGSFAAMSADEIEAHNRRMERLRQLRTELDGLSERRNVTLGRKPATLRRMPSSTKRMNRNRRAVK